MRVGHVQPLTCNTRDILGTHGEVSKNTKVAIEGVGNKLGALNGSLHAFRHTFPVIQQQTDSIQSMTQNINFKLQIVHSDLQIHHQISTDQIFGLESRVDRLPN